MLVTFSMTVFAFIIFRAKDMHHAWNYITEIFSMSIFTKPVGIRNELVWLIVIFMLIEWAGRENKYALEKFGMKWPLPLRLSVYGLIVLLIFWFRTMNDVAFIYFQF